MIAKRLSIAILLIVAAANATFGGSWVSGTAKSATGSIDYKLWVPATYRKEKPVPLVLMLHGCMQNADDIAALSQINELAEKENFLVVYPQQTTAANPLRCWNWFDPKHQERDVGEPSLLAAVIHDVRSSHTIDSQKIYAAGISAGAAMAVLMATAYPDMFAAVGVIAGPEYKAATTVQDGLAAMKQGGPNPNQQGTLAFQAIQKSSSARKRVPVIDFQGSKDPYLNPINAEQLIAQWAQTNDLLDDGKDNDTVSTESPTETKATVPNGYSYTKYSYRDAKKLLLMEKWIVEGMGHAWPGSTFANQFADAKGPNATAEIWRFFRETTLAKN